MVPDVYRMVASSSGAMSTAGSVPGSATGDHVVPRERRGVERARPPRATTTVRTSSDGSSSTTSLEALAVDQQRRRRRVAQRVLELVPEPPGVQADGDRADRLARPERDGPLRVVAHADGHPVALADALCEQVVRQLADAARGPRRTSWSRRRSRKNRASPNAAVASHTSRRLAGALTYTRRRSPPTSASPISNGAPGAVRAAIASSRVVIAAERTKGGQPGPQEDERRAGRGARSDRPRCRRCSARRRWPRRRRRRRRTAPRRVPAAATSAARTTPSPRPRPRAAAPPATGGWPRPTGPDGEKPRRSTMLNTSKLAAPALAGAQPRHRRAGDHDEHAEGHGRRARHPPRRHASQRRLSRMRPGGAPTTTTRAMHAMVASADQLATQAGMTALALGRLRPWTPRSPPARRSPCAGRTSTASAATCWPSSTTAARSMRCSPSAGPDRGPTPGPLRADGLTELPLRHDIRTVTVPGFVDGWLALHERFATLPVDVLLAPAIDLAAQRLPGEPAARRIARRGRRGGRGATSSSSSSQAVRPGAPVRRPGVAAALRCASPPRVGTASTAARSARACSRSATAGSRPTT